ncbi:hypothetical protein RZS08_60010, partial [Arthrospira platensis SPKY1]|nr:hypothetical protein [Arthrospira platensis SPKY1]
RGRGLCREVAPRGVGEALAPGPHDPQQLHPVVVGEAAGALPLVQLAHEAVLEPAPGPRREAGVCDDLGGFELSVGRVARIDRHAGGRLHRAQAPPGVPV